MTHRRIVVGQHVRPTSFSFRAPDFSGVVVFIEQGGWAKIRLDIDPEVPAPPVYIMCHVENLKLI